MHNIRKNKLVSFSLIWSNTYSVCLNPSIFTFINSFWSVHCLFYASSVLHFYYYNAECIYCLLEDIFKVQWFESVISWLICPLMGFGGYQVRTWKCQMSVNAMIWFQFDLAVQCMHMCSKSYVQRFDIYSKDLESLDYKVRSLSFIVCFTTFSPLAPLLWSPWIWRARAYIIY